MNNKFRGYTYYNNIFMSLYKKCVMRINMTYCEGGKFRICSNSKCYQIGYTCPVSHLKYKLIINQSIREKLYSGN